jgi:hypothetical protein
METNMTERTDAAPVEGGQTDSERTVAANRDQADAPLRSAATLAGATPAETSERQRRADAVPLSEGAVTNGGVYQGGRSPDMAAGEDDGVRRPLDARTHFGGDGAQFVDDSAGGRASGRTGTAPDDDGYDPTAGRDATQEV